MDILLVNARLNEPTKHAAKTIPLGLAYMGAVLQKNNYDVGALDLNIAPLDDTEMRLAIERNSPAILGISACTPTFTSGLRFARLAKKINPAIRVVFGGPHASVLSRQVMTEEAVDAVVIGEGEYAMLELSNHWVRGQGTLNQIKGIAYREQGGLRVTTARPPVVAPDDLPFPARDLFPFNDYSLPNAVLASRGGCPFACYFCAVNNIWKGGRCFRKPEEVVKEIMSVLRSHLIPKARVVNFSDDALTMDKRYILHLCRLLQSTGVSLRWRGNTRVDLVDGELLRAMRMAGCYNIEYGIEAGSQQILDSIGKKITLDQIKRAVEMSVNLGIDAECSFMFPHPDDTVKTVKEQFSFMRQLYLMGASETLSLTTPLPGTALYNKAAKLGVKILSKNWDDYDCRHIIISTKFLSFKKLKELYDEQTQLLGMHASH